MYRKRKSSKSLGLWTRGQAPVRNSMNVIRHELRPETEDGTLENLSVRLTGDAGRPIDQVLVAVHWFWHDSFAWACVLGLTDQQGRVEMSAADIRSRYRSSQEMFPMDYKLRFDELESLEVVVEGADDFQRRLAAVDSPLVLPSARILYSQARNLNFRSVRSARLTPQAVLEVELRLRTGAHAG